MRAAALRMLAARRPVRLRLTIVYSGLFLLAGAILLAVTYGMVARGLDNPVGTRAAALLAAGSSWIGNPGLRRACQSGMMTRAQIFRCKQAADASYQHGVTAGAASALHQLLLYSLIALAAMVVVSAMLGWIVAGRALRPVHAITAAAQRASEENLSERIGLAGPRDELTELADTFDAMLERLHAAFTSQRRFVANASHELRTPLTVMRTAVDVTLAKRDRTLAQFEDMSAEVRQAVDQAETLIEALLALARSDRGAGPRECLDLAVLAEDALDSAAPAIEAAGLQPETALEPGPAFGDPVLVERLVTNLIDNAVRHNVRGGWIQVATGIREDMAFIEVANGGQQIPEEEVPSLFEPFRRLDEQPCAPAGVGLGLSIVKSVVAAHHGQVSARNRPAGGLEVSVLLPGEPVRPAGPGHPAVLPVSDEHSPRLAAT